MNSMPTGQLNIRFLPVDGPDNHVRLIFEIVNQKGVAQVSLGQSEIVDCPASVYSALLQHFTPCLETAACVDTTAMDICRRLGYT